MAYRLLSQPPNPDLCWPRPHSWPFSEQRSKGQLAARGTAVGHFCFELQFWIWIEFIWSENILLASKEEDPLDPFIPSSHSTNIGWNEWWAWRQPGWWRTCLGLGVPRNSKVSTWGYQEHSAGDSALLVPLTLCNPGDCQINDKTHFTSRPEVCSGEPKLIAYLILSHQSLIQASTNKSVLHFGSEGLMEWAFPRALVYHESLLRGNLAKLRLWPKRQEGLRVEILGVASWFWEMMVTWPQWQWCW